MESTCDRARPWRLIRVGLFRDLVRLETDSGTGWTPEFTGPRFAAGVVGGHAGGQYDDLGAAAPAGELARLSNTLGRLRGHLITADRVNTQRGR